LASLGLPSSRVRDDLAVIGKSSEYHLAEKATLAITGLLLPVALETLFVLAGVAFPWAIPLIASIVLALGGFLFPDVNVRQEAERRRPARKSWPGMCGCQARRASSDRTVQQCTTR
jgi:hypothetical protein